MTLVNIVNSSLLFVFVSVIITWLPPLIVVLDRRSNNAFSFEPERPYITPIGVQFFEGNVFTIVARFSSVFFEPVSAQEIVPEQIITIMICFIDICILCMYQTTFRILQHETIKLRDFHPVLQLCF